MWHWPEHEPYWLWLETQEFWKLTQSGTSKDLSQIRSNSPSVQKEWLYKYIASTCLLHWPVSLDLSITATKKGVTEALQSLTQRKMKIHWMICSHSASGNMLIHTYTHFVLYVFPLLENFWIVLKSCLCSLSTFDLHPTVESEIATAGALLKEPTDFTHSSLAPVI